MFTLVLHFYIYRTVVSMSYYGLAMNPNFFGGSLYISFIVGGSLEIVVDCFLLFIIKYVGRKLVCMGGFLLASFCLFITLAVPDSELIEIFVI